MTWQQALDALYEEQEPLPEGIGADKNAERREREQFVAAVHRRFSKALALSWMHAAAWDSTNLGTKTQQIVAGMRAWGALAVTSADVEMACRAILEDPQVAVAFKWRGSVGQFLAVVPNVALGAYTVDWPVVIYECPDVMDLPGTGYDANVKGGRNRDNADKGKLVAFYKADSGPRYLLNGGGVLLK